MKAYYEVSGVKNGKEFCYSREDVTKGYYLYKNYQEEEGVEKLSLAEVCGDERIVLRGYGMTPIEEPKKEEAKPEVKEKPKTFEQMWGISEEEYNECIDNFARLHGTTKEAWGL